MNSIVLLASDSVINLYKSRLPKGITYHDLTHTKETAETALEIATNLALSPEEIEMLMISAWFHDVGMIYQYNLHEEKSAEVCQEFLIAQNYPNEKIKKVISMILSTSIPQKPNNLLEEIICDADLSYLGKKEFLLRSILLREEWEKMLGRYLSEFNWLQINLEFLLQNKFHTKYAKEMFNEQRKENIKLIQEKIESYKITPPPKHKSLS